MTTPAEELRTAAAKLRQTAANATPGPWEDVSTDDTGAWPRWILGAPNADGYGQDVLVVHEEVAEAYSVVAREDLAWIALVNPGLAEPLAAWLDACANDIGSITPLAGDLDLFVFCDEPSSVKRAVAVARAINGGTP